MSKLTGSALLEYVMGVSRSIAEMRVLEPLLVYTVKEVLQLVGAERGGIVLLGGDGTLDFRVMRKLDGTPFAADDAVSRSILNEVVQNGASLVLSNAMTDPRFLDAKSVFHLRLRSVMCVPLIFQDEVIGAIYVENRSVYGRFQDADVTPLEIFATQVAASIQNAQLLQAMEQEIIERRRVQAQNQALITNLESKNAALEQFAYAISHELTSPLVTISGFVNMLEQDIRPGPDDTEWLGGESQRAERVAADIRQIRQATKRMQRLLKGISIVLRSEQDLRWESNVPFRELVDKAAFAVFRGPGTRNVSLTIAADMPFVTVDRVRIVEALTQLIENSVKFMGDQPEPHIEIGVHETNGETVFFVRDNGQGIPARFQDQIFSLFEMLETNVEADEAGLGLGLSLVKRIIELHNGRIWVESGGPGKGSTFYFTIPSGS